MENKTILCSDIDDFIQKYDIDIYQKIQGCCVRSDQYSLTSEEYKNLYDLILISNASSILLIDSNKDS